MTIRSALTALFGLTEIDLEAVRLVKRNLQGYQVRLTGSMGFVADPAAITFFSISHDMQVVKVPSFVPEPCIGLGELDLDHGT